MRGLQVSQRKAELPKQPAVPADKTVLSPTTDMFAGRQAQSAGRHPRQGLCREGQGKRGRCDGCNLHQEVRSGICLRTVVCPLVSGG